jgi:hypothetical protein
MLHVICYMLHDKFMNKRKIEIIILSLLIVLLLAIVIYFLWLYKFPGMGNNQVIQKPVANNTIAPNNNLTATPAAATPAKPANVPPASGETITKTNLVKVAESFAERLGSYSNQANFSNISDLKLYMTSSMKSWADKYIAANKKAAYSGFYQGVTTQAVSSEVKNFDDAQGQADILVHTQKVSVNGTSSPVTVYQDITITFVKQNNVWLVDNAVWKK